MHVLLGMWPTQAVSDIVRNLKSNSSAAAFATFSRLGEIMKMDVLWADIGLSPSAQVRLRGSSATSSTKPSIIGQNSDFEPGKMRNTSIMAGPCPRCRGRRHHETLTAHAVGIVPGQSQPLAHAGGW